MLRLLNLMFPAVAGFALSSFLAASPGFAGPPVLHIDIARDRSVLPVLDDGGWRARHYRCCRGKLDGSRGRLSESGHARRLGDARNRYDSSRTYGDRNDDDFSSRYGGESLYEQRLTPPRVYQPGAGGGYFGNPD